MSKLINLTIDDKPISVPEGTLIVDAAKQAGIDIPVFCYHPKLKPAGMCRMCLVEIGRPVIDRATGQPMRQADGRPQYQFGFKLETSCTTPVSEGMEVITTSEKVKAARKDIIEFILTSHPLDCPVCDKGGECPLQNQTLAYGPGKSRYLYDEKMHLAKHVPLGELIYLDRERCIQCGRCIRFQSEIVDDPVIGFYNRGRSFEIVTYSDPGFDSYFSGNTTDICPVGALTTADFRFGARPWELNAAASLCPHCPVGCNLTFNVRREAASRGQVVIKRVMPRQNEAVNEIWICDKGRFAYHYTESQDRLTTPLIRKDGRLSPASWDEALALVTERFRQAGPDVLVLAGGRLPNEDLFNLRHLADGLQATSALYTHMAGGNLTVQFGLPAGTDLGQFGKGDAILVVASDLHEEAPIWYLRVKQATERGAILIVANGRSTRLDRHAAHVLRYPYGQEAESVLALIPDRQPGSSELSPAAATATAAFTQAGKAVILFGSDGLGLAGSQALGRACADLVAATRQNTGAGQENEGVYAVIGVWPRANDQGAWELGFQPLDAKQNATIDTEDAQTNPNANPKGTKKALYVVAADPFGEAPVEAHRLAASHPFLVVQDLFLTTTAQAADVVFPSQAFTEREGTFTSGERRVQRFYPAVPAQPCCRPDYAITAEIGKRLGVDLEGRSPAAVFARISAEIPAFKELNYRKLAESTAQWPEIGKGLSRIGLYFSGTGYENKQGLGMQLPLTPAIFPQEKSGNLGVLGSGAAQNTQISELSPPSIPFFGGENGGDTAQLRSGDERGNLPDPEPQVGDRGDILLAIPITSLYDHGQTVWPSNLLRTRGGNRPGRPWVRLNLNEAARLGITQDQPIELDCAGEARAVIALLDPDVPPGTVLVPRSFGLAVNEPTLAVLKMVPTRTES